MKKKTIKKPKFSSYMTAALVPALIVAILIDLIGYIFADKSVQDSVSNWTSTNPIPYGRLNSYTNLYFRDGTQRKKRNISRLCQT